MNNEVEDRIIFSKMRSMITLMDKLRDFKLDELISLPKITVLGTQSAGKSSLLESICGLNFLPRGSGIVTRRPLELRMVHKNVQIPYFIFTNEFNEKVFTDPDEVRRNIQLLTDKIAGNEQAISDVPIILNVYGATIPDLTIIDLPGITRIAIGDQPKNIEELTKNLVKKYCDDENAVILCVIPANIDMATSESLQFSKEVDPLGERTLGVLTKIDLMDEGVDASNILLNHEIKLKFGYVGIKGRTQKEILEKVTVEKATQNEVDFFSRHPKYSTLPSELLGTRSLIDRVSKILHDLISRSMPRIQQEIALKKHSTKQLLESMGTDFPDTDEKKMEVVFQSIQTFNEYLNQEIAGKLFQMPKTKTALNVKPPKSTETMIYQFNRFSDELFSEYSEKSFEVCQDYTDSYILHAITTYQSENLAGFYSFDSFIFLINPKLQTLMSPVMSLLDETKLIIENKGLEIIDYFFGKHAILASNCKEIFQKILNKYKNLTRKILEKLVICQENYFFSNNEKLLEMNLKVPKNKAISPNQVMVLEMRNRLNNYFSIIVKNMKESVPKIIGNFLLKKLLANTKIEMLQELSKRNYCLESFTENKNLTEQRIKLKADLKALMRAEDLLVSEFGIQLNIKSELGGRIQQSGRKSLTVEEEMNFEDLAEIGNDFVQSSLSQVYQRQKGFAQIKNVQNLSKIEHSNKILDQRNIDSNLLSENSSTLNDSYHTKRYTMDGKEHNKYVLKEETSNVKRTGNEYIDIFNDKSINNVKGSNNERHQNVNINQFGNQGRNEPIKVDQNKNNSGLTSNYDLLGKTGDMNTSDKLRMAKDGYKAYETVNQNFTAEEQKQIVKTGVGVYKYGQDNLTQEQKQTAYNVTVQTGKYLSENVTKEQVMTGARMAYDGAKYVANSEMAKNAYSGTKDLISKGLDSKAKEGDKKKTNLFGDFF